MKYTATFCFQSHLKPDIHLPSPTVQQHQPQPKMPHNLTTRISNMSPSIHTAIPLIRKMEGDLACCGYKFLHPPGVKDIDLPGNSIDMRDLCMEIVPAMPDKRGKGGLAARKWVESLGKKGSA